MSVRTNGWLGRLLMGVLFTAVLGMVAWIASGFDDRLSALETTKAANALDVQKLQSTMCALLDAVYDLREEVSKRPVFRRPCP